MKHINVLMKKDGKETHVRKESVSEMEELGWEAVPKSEEEAEGDPVLSTRVYSDEHKDFQVIHQSSDGKRKVVQGPDQELKDGAPLPPQTSTAVIESNKELTKEQLEEKYAEMSKADLKELLDAKSIAYGANETKAELIAHLTEA